MTEICEHSEMNGNIRFLCPCCIAEMKKEWSDKNILIMPGDYVKGAIGGTNMDGVEITEHMWVDVEKVTKEGFTGSLSNVPEFIREFKHEDTVTIKRENVWNHLKQ